MRFLGMVLGLVLCACGDNVTAVGAIDAAAGGSDSDGQASATGGSGGGSGGLNGGASGATGGAGSGDSGVAADDGGTEQALDAGSVCLGCEPDSGPDTHDAGADASTDARPEDPCQNGIKDGEETDIDCGFGCSPCDDFKRCIAPANCKSGKCEQFLQDEMYVWLCTEPTCEDFVKNGDEMAPDCGGLCPDNCFAGSNCLSDDDCISQHCDLDPPFRVMGFGECRESSCYNQTQEWWEAGVDCGGPHCEICGP